MILGSFSSPFTARTSSKTSQVLVRGADSGRYHRRLRVRDAHHIPELVAEDVHLDAVGLGYERALVPVQVRDVYHEVGVGPEVGLEFPVDLASSSRSRSCLWLGIGWTSRWCSWPCFLFRTRPRTRYHNPKRQILYLKAYKDTPWVL